MQPTRDAARSLVKESKIDVMQKGIVIGVDEEYRGPIRFTIVSWIMMNLSNELERVCD